MEEWTMKEKLRRMAAYEIRALRQRYKENQFEFAARFGVSYVTVSRWERGAARPHSLHNKKLHQLHAARRKKTKHSPCPITVQTWQFLKPHASECIGCRQYLIDELKEL
jgi:transcriptional regulator with XRE-family HTH domain